MRKSEILKILRGYGFKRLKKHHEGIYPYQLGSAPDKSIYAEVYEHIGDDYVWLVGTGIPHGRYPGGKYFYEKDKLIEQLETATKLI